MSKISELSDGGSLLPTDDLIVVRSGGNVRVKADTINVDQIRLGDNEKIELGNAQDLQIYHDGSHSYVSDQGTGNLVLKGNNFRVYNAAEDKLMFAGNNGGISYMYYDGSVRIATSSTGIDVTGTATMDGLTVNSGTANNVATFQSTDAYALIKFEDNDTTSETTLGALDNDMVFRVGAAEAMRIDSSQNVGIGTTPNTRFHVSSAATTKSVIETTGTTSDALIEFTKGQGSGNTWSMGIDHSNSSAFSLAYLSNGSPSLTTHGLLTVDTSGNVKIGTDTDRFSYLTASTANLQIDGGVVFEPGSGNNVEIFNYRSTDMLFGNGATEAMRIDSSQNTHIGGATSISTAVVGDNVAPKLIVEGTTATSIAILRQDTSIESGNSLGSLGFYGTDTTSNTPTPLAAVQALASGLHLAGDNPTDLRFFVTADGSETMAEAGRFAQSGELRTATSIMVGRTANRATQAVGVTDATIVLAGNPNVSGVGDEIGKIAFYNQDASGYGHNLAATIKAVTVTSTGAKAQLIFSTKQGAGEGAEALESMRLTDTGELLVGTTDTTPYNNSGAGNGGAGIQGDGLISAARQDLPPAIFNRLVSNGSIVEFRKDGALVGRIGVESGDNMYIASSETDHTGIYMGGGGILPMNSGALDAGDNVDLGSPNYQFADLHLAGRAYIGDGIKLDSGDGIYFGQDGTAANKLDDYEEGTWTPTVTGSTSAGSYSNAATSANYTKVGNLVTATMYFYGTSGTGAGDLLIGGFPFSLASTSNAVGVIQANSGLVYPTGTNEAVFQLVGNATYGEVRCNKTDGSAFSKMQYPTAAGYIRINITYQAA